MNSIGSSFGSIMHGNQPIIQNGDPWGGMRTVGQQAPMTGMQNLHNMFGAMDGQQQQRQAPQFSPVQFGGQTNGNDLSQLIMALLQQRQGQ